MASAKPKLTKKTMKGFGGTEAYKKTMKGFGETEAYEN